ncbi:MAG: TolC family protein [Reichenbachiella sp.]|uniref:TolC family protein n=1 Tax=Reichenbachiella sp. TaxID=2184521 RepID=UPI0032976C4D
MKIGIVKRMVFLLVLVALGVQVTAQNQDSTAAPQQKQEKKILTLDECMRIAMQNNIELKRSKNNAQIASANYFQSMMEYLPNVSGNINYDWYNGTFFDNTAARQVTEVTNSSNPNLSANMVLFNGFNNHFYRKSTENRREAAINAINEQKIGVESNVLASYLQVVLDKENIKISENLIALLEAQLEREKKRHEVGVGNLELVYNFQSQLANENLNLVTAKNRLMTDMLTLLQVLQLEVSANYDVAPYELAPGEHLADKEQFAEVLESSLSYSPGIKRAVAASEASRYDYKSAQAGYMPTITAFGRIGSSFSSNGARNPETGNYDAGASFDDQMNWNKFDYLNLSMNIPIFNNWRTKNSSQVAKLNMENAALDLEQTELNVTNTIQQVYVDLISAQATHKAAEENLIALNQSFEFAETRYENGNTDFFTYLESLNNKNRAEIELVNAKYQIVFRKKILDVYRGLL